MRVENQEIEGWLGDAAKNEIFLNSELEARDIAIAKLRTELEQTSGEFEENLSTIAKLKAELEQAAGELEEMKVKAIAKPEPTPEPEPKPTQAPEPVTAFLVTEPEPEPIPTPKPVTEFVEGVIVGTPGLLDYINLVDPKSGVTKDEFDNAMTRYFGAIKNGKTPPQGDKSLLFLMAKYNFKHSGKVGRYHQFSIPKL